MANVCLCRMIHGRRIWCCLFGLGVSGTYGLRVDSLQRQKGRGQRRRGQTRKETAKQLAETAQALGQELYAESTRKARAGAKRQVVEFNARMDPTNMAVRAKLPVFVDIKDEEGTCYTAAACARMFFTARRELKQSTLRSLKSHLNAIYEEGCFGLPPWDRAHASVEALATRRFINKLIKEAPASTQHPPLDQYTIRELIRFLKREDPADMQGEEPPLASFAMAAAVALMRGTACRPQEVIKLHKSYVRENWVRKGRGNKVRDGLNIFFPAVDDDDEEVSLKGKKDPMSRFKVMPEYLDDGTHVAGILWDFLQMAPDDSAGPVFQTTTKKRIPTFPWSGKSWTTGIISQHLQRALNHDKVGLGWPWETIKEFTAHSLRSSAATAMARGGVPGALISAVLGHKTQTVTQDHYVQFTKEDMRRALAITGTKTAVLSRGGLGAWTGGL
jgi:integrase